MKRKGILWLIVFIILAVYLVYADRIALNFYDGLVVRVGDFSEYVSTAEGKVCLDNHEMNDELFGEYTFAGWAFCNTTQPNENKEISIVLKSVKGTECYSVTQKPTSRSDVYREFCYGHDIWGVNHGFSAQFTTVPMKDGCYELYIYISENAESKCLLNMNMVFEKRGGYFGLCDEAM